MKYEKGQRVRRSDRIVGDIKAGTLGKVSVTFEDGWFRVLWEGYSRDEMYPPDTAMVEPAADAPAVGAPAKCPRCGKPATNSIDMGGVKVIGCPCVPNDGNLYGIGQWSPSVPGPADVTQLKAELQKAKELAVYWKKQFEDLSKQGPDGMRLGDLKGDNAKLRLDVARLTGDVAYWQREAARLGGKNRGAR